MVKWDKYVMSSVLGLQYLMGIPEFDKQHQELQSKIISIGDLFSTGNFNEAIRELKSIIDDLASHFIDEEKLMREVAFPDLISHTQDHSLILMMLEEILRLSPEENSVLIITSLRLALKDHTLRYDVPMSYFVHNQESFKKTRYKVRKFKALT